MRNRYRNLNGNFSPYTVLVILGLILILLTCLNIIFSGIAAFSKEPNCNNCTQIYDLTPSVETISLDEPRNSDTLVYASSHNQLKELPGTEAFANLLISSTVEDGAIVFDAGLAPAPIIQKLGAAASTQYEAFLRSSERIRVEIEASFEFNINSTYVDEVYGLDNIINSDVHSDPRVYSGVILLWLCQHNRFPNNETVMSTGCVATGFFLSQTRIYRAYDGGGAPSAQSVPPGPPYMKGWEHSRYIRDINTNQRLKYLIEYNRATNCITWELNGQSVGGQQCNLGTLPTLEPGDLYLEREGTEVTLDPTTVGITFGIGSAIPGNRVEPGNGMPACPALEPPTNLDEGLHSNLFFGFADTIDPTEFVLPGPDIPPLNTISGKAKLYNIKVNKCLT